MVALISGNAALEAEREAAMKQAASASRAAEALMDGGDSKKDDKALKEKDQALQKALKDLEAMKTQSANVNKEYDRLMEEKDRLERKLAIMGGGSSGDKKDD